jgi:CheY-like chemotaxis protein
MLKTLGYTATTAEEGAEAVDRYFEAKGAGQPYVAVILDLTVANGVGGLQAMQEIIARDPDARCVATSGYAMDPVMADHRKEGFVAALPKPYDLKSLAAVIELAVVPGDSA